MKLIPLVLPCTVLPADVGFLMCPLGNALMAANTPTAGRASANSLGMEFFPVKAIFRV